MSYGRDHVGSYSGSYGEFIQSNLCRRCPICHGEARIFDRAYGVGVCFSIYGYMGYRVHIRRVEFDGDGFHTEELVDEPTMYFTLMSCEGTRTPCLYRRSHIQEMEWVNHKL